MKKDTEDYYMNKFGEEVEVLQLKYDSNGLRPILKEIWNEAQADRDKEIYDKFRDNCIVIDLDGSTQVITEKKLLEILEI